jgi:hypothetical protein
MNESMCSEYSFEMPTREQAAEFIIRTSVLSRLGITAGAPQKSSSVQSSFERPVSSHDIRLLDEESRMLLEGGSDAAAAMGGIDVEYHAKASSYGSSSTLELTRSTRDVASNSTTDNTLIVRSARPTAINSVGLVWDYRTSVSNQQPSAQDTSFIVPGATFGNEQQREISLLKSRLIPSKAEMTGVLALLKQHTFEY